MYIHISIHKMRNMRTEIGQVMPVATAIMRISAFIAMRLLRGQGLITRHPVPVMMVRDNHRKQCQDAGHQHHVLYNPLFHFLTHGTGINILRIGIITWLNDTHYWLFKIGEATIVFLLFFNLVFKRLFYKHSERISRKNGKHCPFSFFDVKGWIIMIFMIAFGITIRALHLLPNSFISVFYTGLSTALIITGFLFLRQGKTVGN